MHVILFYEPAYTLHTYTKHKLSHIRPGMDECVTDIFTPLPAVLNDVFKGFSDTVYD